jgi:hypothetical protein
LSLLLRKRLRRNFYLLKEALTHREGVEPIRLIVQVGVIHVVFFLFFLFLLAGLFLDNI